MDLAAPTRNDSARGRIAFVDALRGIAVLCMIAWHTAEGWVEPALRDGEGWRWLRLLGGLGAPAFFLLAGASVVLRVGREGSAASGSRARRVVMARGILLIFLGYALHLQFWLLDSLAILRPEAARVWAPAAAGLILVVVGTRRLAGSGPGAAAGPLALGALLFFGGTHQLAFVAPERLEPVLRVDVLQHIGAAVLLVAAACRTLAVPHRPWRALAIAVTTLAVTPIAMDAVAHLPPSVGTWVARGTDVAPGDGSAFPMLPWLAYAFVGAALGATWHRARERNRVVPIVIGLAVLGLVVAFATSESLPHGYDLRQRFEWVVQPMRVTHRIACVLVLAAFALAVTRLGWWTKWLTDTGRASLVVYWVHLELAFGVASRPVHHSLGYVGWAVGATIVTFAMYHAARFRLGPFERWRYRVLREEALSGKRALL